MCLISKHIEPFIAEEDIVCYKVLILVGNNYVTPYQGFSVIIGEVMNDESPIENKVIGDKVRIESGYFHTFKKDMTAITVSIINNISNDSDDFKVFKCIIPKGTEYYIGGSDYCSRSLLITNECIY